MAEYNRDNVHHYTLNGIVVVKGGHWIFLNDEATAKVNDLIIELCNDPTVHRKHDKKGRFIK